MNLYLIFILPLVILLECTGSKNKLASKVETVDDLKALKKVLRTNNNVLVIYYKSKNEYIKEYDLYRDVAEEMRGKATLVFVDCGENKNTCKKMKASPSPLELKHYKKGDFNKNYDRKLTPKSLRNFLKNPMADAPWEEDPSASDVVHLENESDMDKALSKKAKPTLIMFYAPWCGHCKSLKPEYAQAATELKSEAVLGGFDIDTEEGITTRIKYNITGYPTLIYFEKGVSKFHYSGQHNKASLVEWMRDPQAPTEPVKESEWSDEETEVFHLTDSNFEDFIQENPSVLVMFYAPWCGHCKKMKPEYNEAAGIMKDDEIPGALAAVDATKAKGLGAKYEIKGYPTVKYFKDGAYEFDTSQRTSDKIIEFMQNPVKPEPAEKEVPWEETISDVVHLDDESFKTKLKKKKHSLIMFYAPWCGHCKKAKPHFMNAAKQLVDDSKVMFAAVDCTKHQKLCQSHDVSGYPTFKYVSYGKNFEKYTGGREEIDFINFMKNPLSSSADIPAEDPSAQWSGLKGANFLNHLTLSNFDKFINSQSNVLVMFHSPSCGFCKRLKPIYAEVAVLLKESKVNAALATVDATLEQPLADMYDIRGYPTLKMFRNGELDDEYEGDNSVEGLYTYITQTVTSDNEDIPSENSPDVVANESQNFIENEESDTKDEL